MPPPNSQRIGDILGDREMRKESEGLKYHSEAAPVGRNAGLVDRIEQYLACGRNLEASDEAQESRLAATGRAEKANELAVRNFDGDVVNGGHASECLG